MTRGREGGRTKRRDCGRLHVRAVSTKKTNGFGSSSDDQLEERVKMSKDVQISHCLRLFPFQQLKQEQENYLKCHRRQGPENREEKRHERSRPFHQPRRGQDKPRRGVVFPSSTCRIPSDRRRREGKTYGIKSKDNQIEPNQLIYRDRCGVAVSGCRGSLTDLGKGGAAAGKSAKQSARGHP